jgi:predicted AlkP superfamily phosphohydrolase/phosphomutase
MTAQVLVIGLDAAEAPLLERWAADGSLPHLAAVIAGGTTAHLTNCLDTLPGAIWPEIAMGISGARTGLYFIPRQVHTGEAVVRSVTQDEYDADAQYWAVASRHGRRACTLDVPQTVPVAGADGVQVFEWGLHDREFEIQSEPPEVLDHIRARWGDHPVDICDLHHGRTTTGYRALLEALERGADAKTAWASELLEREHWDVFSCVWSECHCVGHQLHHFLDPTHPAHEPEADPLLLDSWRRVYQRIDAGIGRLMAAAGPEATVLVIASHGMASYIAGYQLLPEVLTRLGTGPQASKAATAPGRLPAPVRSLLRAVIPARTRHRRLVATGNIRTWNWLESPTCRAAPVENNRVGAIRLNIRGREPHGAVEPGAEADELTDELRRELLALRLPGTETPIVREVLTPIEAFGPDHHPDLPDLMVVFRRDIGPLDRCWSERIGLVEVPIGSARLPRTGDHTDESRLWTAGPGIVAGGLLPPGDVLDLAPTILDLLEVPIPDGLDGRPLDLTAGSTSPPAAWRVAGGRALTGAGMPMPVQTPR